MARTLYYNEHFSVGMGKVSAFSFGDSKETHSTVLPEDKSSGSKIAKWGDDNRYPQNFMKTLRKNGAGSSSFRFLKAAHYGQGFTLYREDTSDDGKRDRQMVPIRSVEEVYTFFKRCKMNKVWTEIIADLEHFSLGLPEFILSNDYSEIVSVRRQKTAHGRYELINPKTGLIENIYLCTNWQAGTSLDSEYVSKVPIVDSYCSVEEVKEYCKSKKIHKFIMPIFYPLIDEVYYPEPESHATYRNGWMDVVNAIPEYKKHYAENQANIKYLVKVSEQYFLKTYKEEWHDFSTEEKQQKRKALADAIDDHLAGNKNAGKSLMVTKFYDENSGQWVDGIELEEIGTKGDGAEGKGILDASAGNAEIMGNIGTDPNLMGVGIPGGKMNSEGGSNKREAFSILNSLMKTKREVTLDIWRFLRDYNEWDDSLEGDFAVTELTTLDKNPTGTENKF